MCTVDLLYQYSCEWNYRPDHCMYMSNCHAAELHGVSVLHGCRRAFHIDKWPVFRAIYQAVENVSWHQLITTTLSFTSKAWLTFFADRSRSAKTFPLLHTRTTRYRNFFFSVCAVQFSVGLAQFYFLCMCVWMHELCMCNPALGCQRSINLYMHK